MLLKGSIVWIMDNSGGATFKVLQLYSELMDNAGECFRGVLKKFNPNKNKLAKKKHYSVACLGTLVPVHRLCDNIINFPINSVIMLNDLKSKLLGSRIWGAMVREALRLVGLEQSLIQRIVLLSRIVL